MIGRRIRLEHNFRIKARANRNFYLLMQLADSLWQMFSSGIFYTIAEAAPQGCAKSMLWGCRDFRSRNKGIVIRGNHGKRANGGKDGLHRTGFRNLPLQLSVLI